MTGGNSAESLSPGTLMPDIREHYNKVRQVGEKICDALRAEVTKLGLDSEQICPRLERASYELQRDPAGGEYSLVGTWRDHNGAKQGTILFNVDGSFFAEYDVIHQHPKKPRWFVEAVTAWGHGSSIKSEPRLIPMPS